MIDLLSSWPRISPSGAAELLDADQTRGVSLLHFGNNVTAVVLSHALRVVLSTADVDAQLATTTGGFFAADRSNEVTMRVYPDTGVRTLPDITFPVRSSCGNPDLSCAPSSIGAGSVGPMSISRAEYSAQVCSGGPIPAGYLTPTAPPASTQPSPRRQQLITPTRRVAAG